MKETVGQWQYGYDCDGAGPDVILLHGWGADRHMMRRLHEHVAKQCRCYNLDVMGFGESVPIQTSMGVLDYVEWLHAFVRLHDIETPILMVHSFGGRIALAYAARYPVKQLILMGAAGVRPPKKWFQKCKELGYHIGKECLTRCGSERWRKAWMSKWGSDDYRQASPLMKETMVKCLAYDCLADVPHIDAATLCIYGEFDTATPPWMGKAIAEGVQDGALLVVPHEDHFAYWHRPQWFETVIDAFIQKGGGKR